MTGETSGGWKHLRHDDRNQGPLGRCSRGDAGRCEIQGAGLRDGAVPLDAGRIRRRSKRRSRAGCTSARIIPTRSRLSPGSCPIDQNTRVATALLEHQRRSVLVPDASGGHRPITAGEKCSACGGMELKPRIVSFRPAGQVLAVPRSAVIDGGSKKVVFIESMPGMFDGVEVVLGPRCGEFYPVVRGLEAGQRWRSRGPFCSMPKRD